MYCSLNWHFYHVDMLKLPCNSSFSHSFMEVEAFPEVSPVEKAGNGATPLGKEVV